MKTLIYLVKTKMIFSLMILLSASNAITAQDISGKWKSLLYNEYVHFHEEGVLRIEGENGDGFGMYALEGDFLVTAYFNEEETRMQYTISFDEEGTLNLQESETGEVYPFVYIGEAEIPDEVLEKVRLALDSENPQSDENFSEVDLVSEENLDQLPTSENFETVSSDLHSELPGTLPTRGTRGSSGIVGTWQQESSAMGKETLVLTVDGFFMMTAEAMFPDLYPQTYGYGRYDYTNGQLALHFFNFFQTYDKETVLNIRDLNDHSFNVPFDFYGDIQDNRYLYQGAPVLSENHRKTLLAWVNFHRLQGQWRSKDSVLKFMANGEVFVESSNGKYTFSQFDISTDGVTANFEPIDGENGNYFYNGKILELTPEKLVLQDVNGGDPEIFAFQGETQLNAEQIQLYTVYMNGQHRVNMGIIDMMDGRQDWIWVKEKNY